MSDPTMPDYDDLELEGHTVMLFRCHTSLERRSFIVECVTKANRQMMIEFPSEGPKNLLHALEEAFEKYPQMREWKSPTAH